MASIDRVVTGAGVRWRVRWRDGGRGTRERAKSFRTQADARLFLARVNLGQHHPEVAPETPPVVTVSALVASRASSRVASRATVVKERSLAVRLGPLLDRPVDTITPGEVRALVAALVADGLAPETVGAVLRYLRAVLETAVDDGLLATNPAARVKPPRIQRPPLTASDVYSLEEVRRLIESTPVEHRALMALLAYCGPRFSEATGVDTSDYSGGVLHLGRQVVEEVAGVVRLRAGGKTRGSDRFISLPAPVRHLVETHLEGHGDGLIFAGQNGGPLSVTNWRRRVYAPAVTAAGLEHRGVPLRNLRHTAASIGFAAGLSPLQVAAMLGHSRPSMTLDTYARLGASSALEGVQLLDAFLS